ncbi:Class II flagellar assembly regulator [Devosia crocina]|uniref:Class II flagellar assembly regulator n=1 Tax=Devosia crocina TaxID=429728 RepID=A0A1I7N7W3_9HYPH|nr:Class II flagellar assembly regulator [Devosia crocina]
MSQSVRIESANRMANVSARGAVGKFSPGGTFTMADVAAPQRAARPSSVAPVAPLDAILALQGVEDATSGRRRKAVKHGSALLDLLDGIKADLLVGEITVDRLEALVLELSVFRDRTEPGLDAVLDDIELRVRVELAKQGLFPPL